jgi:glutaredoxin
MLTVYGADWCEDTRRSLRHLRRLGVPHEYVNIDEDSEGLAIAKSLNNGERRMPTIDLGAGGNALVEPTNDTLSGALVELEMLTQEDLHERLAMQNVGDSERVIRSGVGTALILGASCGPRASRWPLRVAGAVALLTGISGWCPLYHAAGVTSLEGPGDRPDEAQRSTWLAPAVARQAGGPAAASVESPTQ